MSDDEKQDVYDDFNDAVNMTPKELENWLETDQAKEAGDHGDGGESTGHKSGRRIVEIKHTKKADLSDADYDHMKKVVGYVKRHLEQKPGKSKDELEGMTWTHSLKNWGHDPLK